MNKLKTIQNKEMLGKIRTMQLTRQQYVLLQNLLTIQLWENRKKQNSLENKSELGIEENRLLYIYKKLESTIKEINKEIFSEFRSRIEIIEKKNAINQSYIHNKIIKLKKSIKTVDAIKIMEYMLDLNILTKKSNVLTQLLVGGDIGSKMTELKLMIYIKKYFNDNLITGLVLKKLFRDKITRLEASFSVDQLIENENLIQLLDRKQQQNKSKKLNAILLLLNQINYINKNIKIENRVGFLKYLIGQLKNILFINKKTTIKVSPTIVLETLEFLKSKTIVRNKENKVKKHTELEKNIKIVKKKEINPKFKFKIYNQIINEFAPNLNIEEGLVNNLNKKINIESQF